ncbi:prostate and testis expressed protein 1 [Orycteropus afer afer]|uniref:Prostate and testis expressed protein 1 n=1 Tax=Orycteropus afer afer TaxID=1230840 RepID=A0A8B7ARK2_ORYAF|nr:prostate and testis expressed protein 1 [Orycteropus afer afer]
MDKFLLLRHFTFLCCLPSKFQETVQCRMCHLQFPEEKCSRGRGICNADINEACVLVNISRRAYLLDTWLAIMGCQKNCADVQMMHWGIYTVKFRCCRDSNLCNEKL